MKLVTTTAVLLALVFAASAALADEENPYFQPIPRMPHVMPTADEIANPHLYHQQFDYNTYSPPPSLGPPPDGPVVRPGEFEEMDSTLITPMTWSGDFSDMFTDMMYAFAFAGPVMIIATEQTKNYFEGQLINAGVPANRFAFLYYPYDAIWIRDYGPEFVLDEDGTRHIIDAKYHPDRPNDDAIPIWIGASDWINTDGSEMEVHSHEHGLNGGNIFTDGAGTCFFTNIIYGYEKPSGWTNDDVDTLMIDYYGCEQIISLKPICNDGTGHIDLYAKLMGPTSILLGEFPPDTYFADTNNAGTTGHCGDSTPNDYQDQEDNLATIEATTNLADEPWVVTRLHTLEPFHDGYGWVYRSYMNSEIFNDVVLMPTYYDETGPETVEELLDFEAQATEQYEIASPGIWVFPIDSDHIIPLAGAMHCIAHEVPVDPHATWSIPSEYCGDGEINGDEECDGPDFGDQDCTTFGFAVGGLICDMYCAIDTSDCEGEADTDSETETESETDAGQDAGPPGDGGDDDCGCRAVGASKASSLLQLLFS
jgi:agmatine/peptidylarginine deiminase